DSALMRDLTLAAGPRPSSTPLPTLGDTAAGQSAPRTRAAERSPAPSMREVTPRRTVPVRTRQPDPEPVVSERPATPVLVPAVPVSAPTVPAPAGSSTGTAPVAGSGTGRRSLGAGTSLVGRTDAEICSIANRPGDRFVATLVEEVSGPDGGRIPAGTPVLVELAQAGAGQDFAFRVKAVQVNGTLIPVEGTVRVEGTPTERRVSKGGDKEKVVTGAVVGAILGRVLGGGTKGTVIGAAGGAAAGTVAAARNSVTERCLPAGATLTVTLSSPLVLTQGVP
ncbi:MAG: glycine zipper 2TM domain-containing protein, partial [Gemmatimonas sp.]